MNNGWPLDQPGCPTHFIASPSICHRQTIDLQAKVTQITISWVSNLFFLIVCASRSWRHGDGSNLFPTLAALWFKSSRPPGTSAQKISAWLDLAADVIIVIVLRSDCDQLFTRVVATFALRSICWLHSWCMTQERGSGTCLTHLVRVTPGMYGPLHSFLLQFFQQCVSEFHMLNLDLVNEIERAFNSEISRGFFRHHQRVVKNDTHSCLGWTTMDCGCTCGHLAVHFAGWIHRIDPPLAAVASFTEDNEVPKCSKLDSLNLWNLGEYTNILGRWVSVPGGSTNTLLWRSLSALLSSTSSTKSLWKSSWNIHWVGMSVYSPFCPCVANL